MHRRQSASRAAIFWGRRARLLATFAKFRADFLKGLNPPCFPGANFRVFASEPL
jgi:hypothetical protein